MAPESDGQKVKMERRDCEPMLLRHVWPALGKRRTPGDILYWPRDDQLVPFTHWAVYIGRRKLAPHGQSWMVDTCEVTGAELPEAVVHLWGAADSSTRDMSSDAVVVYNRVDEVGGTPYDGNLKYDAAHTPMKPDHILERCLKALGHKVYEERFGGYHVLGNNCEHFATWARYGWNQSDQVFKGAMLGAAGLSFINPGLGALAMGVTTMLNKEISSLRRTQSNNFKDHAEDADEEVDWVVDSLVRNTEDHFKALDEETRAYAERREHLPRGATMLPEEEAEEERKRTLLHFDSRTSRLNVAGWDIKFGGERVEEGDENEALKEENAPEETTSRSHSERPARRHDRDPVEDLKGIATGVGSLAASLFGGMLKVGGALASEIASQHNAHQEKLRLVREREDAEARERGEIAPPAGVVIEEIAD